MRGIESRPVSLELHNTRFEKDLRHFRLLRGPSSPIFDIPSSSSDLNEGTPTAGRNEENSTPVQLRIDLEAWEVGKGRLGRCFRGTLSRLSSSSSSSLPSSNPNLDLPSSSPSCDAPMYPVIVKLVAPHARLIKHDNRRHTIYHPSQRTPSASLTLLEELKTEAEWYDESMRGIQGLVVPRFYGYGVSISGDGDGVEDGKAACLILEDCGVSLTYSYQKLSLEDR